MTPEEKRIIQSLCPLQLPGIILPENEFKNVRSTWEEVVREIIPPSYEDSVIDEIRIALIQPPRLVTNSYIPEKNYTFFDWFSRKYIEL